MQAEADPAWMQTLFEIARATTMLLAAGALFFGCVLAAATWIHPAPLQFAVTVHFDSPITVHWDGPPPAR